MVEVKPRLNALTEVASVVLVPAAGIFGPKKPFDDAVAAKQAERAQQIAAIEAARKKNA